MSPRISLSAKHIPAQYSRRKKSPPLLPYKLMIYPAYHYFFRKWFKKNYKNKKSPRMNTRINTRSLWTINALLTNTSYTVMLIMINAYKTATKTTLDFTISLTIYCFIQKNTKLYQRENQVTWIKRYSHLYKKNTE